MRVLVLNAGSSSLKYAIYDLPGEREQLSGTVERIEGRGGHRAAVAKVAATLSNQAGGKIDAVGHRVVHGGEAYGDAVTVDESVEGKIADLSALAPLHNPDHLEVIAASKQAFPGVAHVAVFDTAFHQTIPEHAYRFPIPNDLYTSHRIRRYGFHGTSHRYVADRAAQLLGADTFTGVTCHLGNGSSLAAIQDGESVDTSMGLTPLGGIPMGTRSGDLDPAVLIHLQVQLGYSPDQVAGLLNKESGLLGLSEVSNDLREIQSAADAGDSKAKLAIEVLVYQIAKGIGGFLSILRDAKGIVFTGGIGENAAGIRAQIVGTLAGYKLGLDGRKNESTHETEEIISTVDSALPVMVIPTREDLMIARETYRIAHCT